ncbi:MAG: asparaginase domain-containing protein [Acidobacteriota bacterium]|jgi:L-asparaginase
MERQATERDRGRVCLVTTGGTIEKVYDEHTGEMVNRRSIVRRMLSELRLEGIEVEIVELMSKDSLDMDEDDRTRVVEAVRAALAERPAPAGVVILHGTDTLTDTGERLLAAFPQPPVPVVLTGAMRPFEMKRSDALQNLTEALFAARALAPAIYCVAHGRALRFPGVVKERRRGTFVPAG